MQQKNPQQQMSPPTTPTPNTATTPPPPPVHIPYKLDWIFEKLKNPSGLWYICSQLAIFAVGLFSKFVLGKV